MSAGIRVPTANYLVHLQLSRVHLRLKVQLRHRQRLQTPRPISWGRWTCKPNCRPRGSLLHPLAQLRRRLCHIRRLDSARDRRLKLGRRQARRSHFRLCRRPRRQALSSPCQSSTRRTLSNVQATNPFQPQWVCTAKGPHRCPAPMTVRACRQHAKYLRRTDFNNATSTFLGFSMRLATPSPHTPRLTMLK